MKPVRRPNGSLYLLATALLLALAFSVWCINLAISVRDQRADIGSDVRLMMAIEDVRAILDEAAPDNAMSWRKTTDLARARLGALGDRDGLTAVAAGQLAQVESALAAAPETTGQVGETQRTINVVLSGAVAAIRGETTMISATLGTKWASLNLLAFLSVISVAMLAVLMYRGRAEASRHERAEHELRESESRFRSVLSALPDVVLVMSAGGEYRYIYTAKPGLLVEPVENLVGQSIHTRMPEPVRSDAQAVIDRTIESDEMQMLEYPLTIRGEDKWFTARVVPFGTPGDPCVLWVARDRTEQHRAEERRFESEERFRLVAAYIDEVVWLAARDGTIEYVSPAYETIWGRSCQSLYDNSPSWLDLLHEDDRARVEQAFEAGRETGEYDVDYRIIRDDGSVRWIRDRGFAVRDAEGEMVHLAGLAQDVTDQRLAAEAIRESEQRFRSAFEDTRVGMALSTPTGSFTRVNRAFCEMMGYTEQELLAMAFTAITHPDDVEMSLAHAAKVCTGEISHFTIEKRYVRRNGAVVWSITSVAPVLDAAGRADYLVVETQDITERKRAEEQLRDSEERFRSIFELAGAGMHTAAPDGRYLQVNRAFCKFLGYTPEELAELTVADVTYADDLQMTIDQFSEVQAGTRNVCDLVKRYVRKDGAVVWGHVTAVWLPATENRDAYGVAMVQDVDEQRRAGQALIDAKNDLERRVVERTADLVASNEKLIDEIGERKMAENIQRSHTRVLEELARGRSLEEILNVLVEGVEGVYSDMLCVILLLDEDGEHLRLGAAPGIPESLHGQFEALPVGPESGCCGEAVAGARRIIVNNLDAVNACRGGMDLAKALGVQSCWSQPIFSSDDEVLGIFAIYYREPRSPDQPVLEFITSAAHLAGIAIERRRAEARLAESQERLRVSDRLASLGTLVAGLGHDMNNVLFPLRCRLDALNWDELPANLREVVESSRDSVDYLQQLGSGLRLLAADPEDTGASVEVTAPLAWWAQVEPLISKMIPDEVSIAVDIPEDLPLITVAPHRLTQAVMNLIVNAAEAMPSGGRVRIDVSTDGTRREVAITVRDEGVGMSDEIRQRALDPFFTTKKRSLSTGLGLSLVLGVVRRSKGTLRIDSRPGEGTAVRLVFPAARVSGARRRRCNGGPDSATVSLRDLRTAAWVSNVLESAGYTVSVAEDGDPRDSDIWVTEATHKNLTTARRFLTGQEQGQIIVLGSAGTAWTGLGAIVVEDASNLDAIKSAVCEVAPIPS